ncbi:DUF6232 family protein [Micromonospora sp. NPDC050417]|uniref:DUF6232 family protein n=1 Tax=Micromonospora sp. NPDC050417 TaxID=3364280 RepID=UPI0037A2E525
MITYYDDRSVRVTSEAIRVADRAYPLMELAEIWHQRGTRSWRVLANRGALGIGLIGPVVAALIGIALAIRFHSSITVTLAIIGASCLVGFAVGPVADLLLEFLDRSYTRGSHRLEIWVRWHGEPVRLLQTTDALRFGQIYRALQRAVEQRQRMPRPR